MPYTIDNPIAIASCPCQFAWLGNSSVASLPTLYDLIAHNQLGNYHQFNTEISYFLPPLEPVCTSMHFCTKYLDLGQFAALKITERFWLC